MPVLIGSLARLADLRLPARRPPSAPQPPAAAARLGLPPPEDAVVAMEQAITNSSIQNKVFNYMSRFRYLFCCIIIYYDI